MSDSTMSIYVHRARAEATIALRGECDISNVGELDRTLREVLATGVRRVVFDFEGIRFVGACVLQSIEVAAERLRTIGGVLVIERPPEMLAWMLA